MNSFPPNTEPILRRGLVILGAVAAILPRVVAAEATQLTAIDILIEPGQRCCDVQRRRTRVYGRSPRWLQPRRHAPSAHRASAGLCLDCCPRACLRRDRRCTGNGTTRHVEAPGGTYYFLPVGGLGAAGIVVEASDDLRESIRGLSGRHALHHGGWDRGGLRHHARGTDVNQPTVDYVTTSIDQAAAARFNPHVTIGMAPQSYLRRMLDEPFEKIEFDVAGVTTYQLGNLGTARRKLHDFELRR